MTYENILYNLQDDVATITLNRPQTYNALTMGTISELIKAMKAARKDAARAIVLTGTGKGFSSGADLVEINNNPDVNITEALRNGLNTLVQTMRGLELPIICAVNGVAAGAGAAIPLAADYRIAADNASFVFAAFVNIGLVPDAGSTYLLQQIVGPARALELALFADSKNRVDASTALDLGLVSQVVPADDLDTNAHALATKLATMPTKAIAMTKRAIYRAYERSLTDSMDYEAMLQGAAFKTHDFKEGVTAFLEKREPVFKGD